MAGRPVRVLVVEDEPAVRTVICRTLRAAGHEVLEADTEWAALELALTARPDAVVMDFGLPDGDGVRTMAGIRCLRPGTALIVVSGGDREEILERAVRAGLRVGIYWVGKPFTADLLVRTVEEAVA